MRNNRLADFGGRLFRYDLRIAVNVTRTALSGWHDRLIAVTIVVGLLAAVNVQADGLPQYQLVIAGIGVGSLLGASIGRLLTRRLAYHVSDGSLAADALDPFLRRRYATAWQVIGLAIMSAPAAIAGADMIAGVLIGYPIGALAAHLGGRLPPRDRGWFGLRRAGPGRRHRPLQASSLIGASVLLLAIAIGRLADLDTDMLMLLAGLTTVTVMLALTAVDDQSVRFGVLTGDTPGRILLRHGRAAINCVAFVLPPSLLFVVPQIALAILATSTMMLLVMALRTLAYALHGKRFAETLVAIVLALLVAVATTAPLLAPIVVAVILSRLWHRAAARRWLLG